jgi:hypothetical protein
MAWARAQPLLAVLVLGFCLVAIGGLVLSAPRGSLTAGRTLRSATGATATAPVPRASAPGGDAPASRIPGSSAEPPTPALGDAGPWVRTAPSPPSARGLALVYRYRTLPPGGESRYEWIVQVQGAESVLAGVDVVSWEMDPPAKNGASFISRDRAADGFPLFGHGPGGWFGVSARVRFRDGEEEALTRRIELSE